MPARPDAELESSLAALRAAAGMAPVGSRQSRRTSWALVFFSPHFPHRETPARVAPAYAPAPIRSCTRQRLSCSPSADWWPLVVVKLPGHTPRAYTITHCSGACCRAQVRMANKRRILQSRWRHARKARRMGESRRRSVPPTPAAESAPAVGRARSGSMPALEPVPAASLRGQYSRQ